VWLCPNTDLGDPSLLADAHAVLGGARGAWGEALGVVRTGSVCADRGDGNDPHRWCAAQGVERGDVVTLERLNELARAWYDNHLDSAWRKVEHR
jgi:hypothetical protein